MTVITGMTMSLDGFVADRDGDASPLYPDLTAFDDNEILQESIDSTGAVVMGRGAYEMAEGDLTGYEYQVPIFVLTHHPPDEEPKGQSEGGLTVEFVTDGLERAIEKAKSAAGEKDVTVVGGADVTQQCLRTGLFDELHIALVPIFLGKGLRLFENLGDDLPEVKQEQVIETDWAGHSDATYFVFRNSA
ncbi:dihydrofolate reductase family protein [Haladaptatus salinisoli]|uniref:dihydrofolate reductase family protein n=1 Tax=Haladaptatus salinisoli TaxID=2884876 RepID=UPI001D0BDDA9|nr:dihydrofolate reductase family protein [Haladaptatus salinisoli]